MNLQWKEDTCWTSRGLSLMILKRKRTSCSTISRRIWNRSTNKEEILRRACCLRPRGVRFVLHQDWLQMTGREPALSRLPISETKALQRRHLAHAVLSIMTLTDVRPNTLINSRIPWLRNMSQPIKYTSTIWNCSTRKRSRPESWRTRRIIKGFLSSMTIGRILGSKAAILAQTSAVVATSASFACSIWLIIILRNGID